MPTILGMFFFLLMSFLQADTCFEFGVDSLQDLLGDTNTASVRPLRVRVVEDIQKWISVHASRGINVLNIPILDQDKFTICNSKVLQEAGFCYIKEIEDIFPFILEEAQKNNVAISIPLNDLATVIEEEHCNTNFTWSPSKVAQFLQEIANESRPYQVKLWINEGSFSTEYQTVVSDACQSLGIMYLRHFGDWSNTHQVFCMEDYATYPCYTSLGSDWKIDEQYVQRLQSTNVEYCRLGLGNLVWGFANAHNRPVSVNTVGAWGLCPGAQIGIMLYRGVQCAPILYAPYYAKDSLEDATFVRQISFKNDVKIWLDALARQPADSPKPVANVIISVPQNLSLQAQVLFQESLYSSLDAITNAITAAGFDIKVTRQIPLEKNVNLYYIFTDGDISDEVMSMFPTNKPVFIQSASGFFYGKNREKISQYLGFTSHQIPILSHQLASPTILHAFPSSANDFRAPTSYMFQYHFVAYQGIPFDRSVDTYRWANISSEHLSPDTKVIAKDLLQLPLITQNKNYFFVNGNFLHLAASNVLANIIAFFPVFYSPSCIYLTTGAERSALFSCEDTELNLYLPVGKIYHWTCRGILYPNTNLFWEENRLRGKIKKWELVVIATERH